MDIRQRIEDCKEELVKLRRDFHRFPELGFEEWETQKRIINYLSNLGIETREIAGTGVVATIKGKKPGKTALLRSDMDALPVNEETGLSFASTENGKMHACGHDGHMAMLLVAAKILHELRGKLQGTIKCVFQPNEEDAGAFKLIEEGVMDSPKVDYCFGIHLWSQIPSGTIDIVEGPQMASSRYFYLTVKGKGGHAGFAHASVDPIIAATNIVQSLQSIQTREIPALSPVVIMFTAFNAGSNTTIIPEKTELKGSIRALHEGDEDILRRFERIVAGICKGYRVDYELTFKIGNRLLKNDPTVTRIVRETATEILGDETKVTSNIRTMAGEDFSEYLRYAPGAFAFVGTGNRESGSDYPHHHPRFNIDEGSLPLGVELHIRTALKLLACKPLFV